MLNKSILIGRLTKDPVLRQVHEVGFAESKKKDDAAGQHENFDPDFSEVENDDLPF